MRISFSLTSFYFYFKIISFFYYQILRLLCQIQRFDIFQDHVLQSYLYQVQSFIIQSQIQEIMSIVTMFWTPFFNFYLFSLMRSQIYFSFIDFETDFSWAFCNNLSFQRVFCANTLHYSFIFDNWDRDFQIFQVYWSSFFKQCKAFSCSFLTLARPAFSISRGFISPSRALMAFYFSITAFSSQTYSFSFFKLKIQFLSQTILISCFLASNFCASVPPSSYSSRLIPYFFFL